MKRIQILLFSFLLATTSTIGYGQGLYGIEKAKSKHNIRYTVGYGSIYHSILGIQQPNLNLFGPTINNSGNAVLYSYPTHDLSYAYRISNVFEVGGALTYSGLQVNQYSNSKRETLTQKNDISLMAVSAIIRGYWFESNLIRLYSSAQIGAEVGLSGNNPTRFLPAFDIRVIGITVGRQLYGCAEAGWGVNGCAWIGIGYRL